MKVKPPEQPSAEVHYDDPAYSDPERIQRGYRRPPLRRGRPRGRRFRAGARAPGKAWWRGARVRAFRPPRARAPGHVVVEPLEPVASLLEAEPELLLELLSAVKQVAKEVMRKHGACRVETDLGAPSERLRWHVYAPAP